MHYLVRSTLDEARMVTRVNRAFLASDLRQWRDKRLLALARRLPPRLLMWCYIVVLAHATGKSPLDRTPVERVDPMAVLKIWDEDHALR